MRAFSTAGTALCLALIATAAGAQQDLEPGVQTSPPAAPATGPAHASPSASPSAASAAASAAPGTIDGKPKNPKAASSAAPSARPTAAPAPAVAAAPKAGKSGDRIELDTTQISGNRELPKVMYVVPWRKADPGEFAGRPLNSLLDEALTPVDRDVFRRQNRYYATLQGQPGPDKSQPGAGGEAPAAPTAKDEK